MSLRFRKRKITSDSAPSSNDKGLGLASVRKSSRSSISQLLKVENLSQVLGDAALVIEDQTKWRLASWQGLSRSEQTQVQDILAENMKSLYESSTWGWNAELKLLDLASPKSRFILAQRKREGEEEEAEAEDLQAYACIFFEGDGIFLYELQVSHAWHRQGFGTRLMAIIETIGRNYSLQRITLTVFTHNAAARKFYAAQGYAEAMQVPRVKSKRNRTALGDMVLQTEDKDQDKDKDKDIALIHAQRGWLELHKDLGTGEKERLTD